MDFRNDFALLLFSVRNRLLYSMEVPISIEVEVYVHLTRHLVIHQPNRLEHVL